MSLRAIDCLLERVLLNGKKQMMMMFIVTIFAGDDVYLETKARKLEWR